MTLNEQIKTLEAEGFTLDREHSFLLGDYGWLRLIKGTLFKLFKVEKEQYEQAIR